MACRLDKEEFCIFHITVILEIKFQVNKFCEEISNLTPSVSLTN